MRHLAPLALCALLSGAAPAQEPAPFGFAGHEIYELGAGCGALRAADLNGDGLGDLVVSNPRRSRLELLLRLDADAADYAEPARRERANRIDYDGRFAIRHHPVERQVLQLETGDWNGDGFGDVAWVAAGGELHTLLGDATGEAPKTAKRRVEALRGGCVALEAADLDGDGDHELLAAGAKALVALEPLGKGASSVRRIDATPGGSGAGDLDGLAHADLDGDGRDDLVYLFHGDEFGVRYRPGLAGGHFGPRADIRLPPLRDARVVDLDGDERADLLAVFQDSGRMSVLDFARSDPARSAGGVERQGLRPLEGRDSARSFTVGDLDGDGAAEILVAEPDVSEVVVLTLRDGGLDRAGYPSLVDVGSPRIGDLDGDGRRELVTISASERMIGVSRPDESGALPFPRTLPVEGEPLAVAVADLDGNGADEIVLLTSSGSGRSKVYSVVTEEAALGESSRTTQPLEGLKKTPTGLELVDLDQDGSRDLLIFLGDRDAPALAPWRDGAFALDSRGADVPGLGVLTGAGPGNISLGDVDGDGRPELIAASKNFARALRFEPDGQVRLAPVVVAQFNGPAADSSIRVGLLAKLVDQALSELVLFDARERELLIYGLISQPPKLVARIYAGGLEVDHIEAADLDGDGVEDLVLLAQDQIAIRFGNSTQPALTPRASFDPQLEDTYLDTVAAGDLNGDGTLDALVVEGFEHQLMILSEQASSESAENTGAGLAQRLEFQVFEKGPLEEGRSREPREVLCTEIDGDGATDVAVLVHDKLIVYLQDSIE